MCEKNPKCKIKCYLKLDSIEWKWLHIRSASHWIAFWRSENIKLCIGRYRRKMMYQVFVCSGTPKIVSGEKNRIQTHSSVCLLHKHADAMTNDIVVFSGAMKMENLLNNSPKMIWVTGDIPCDGNIGGFTVNWVVFSLRREYSVHSRAALDELGCGCLWQVVG